MPHHPLLPASVLLLLAAPVSAQVGLASSPRSVTLSATRLPTMSLALAAPVTLSASVAPASNGAASLPVTTAWSCHAASPTGYTLIAEIGVPGIRSVAVLPVVVGSMVGGSPCRPRTDIVPVPASGTVTLVAITQ